MTEPVAPALQLLLTALDFTGTFVFALSGAVAGAKRGQDLNLRPSGYEAVLY